jgi:hypothetical protein
MKTRKSENFMGGKIPCLSARHDFFQLEDGGITPIALVFYLSLLCGCHQRLSLLLCDRQCELFRSWMI